MGQVLFTLLTVAVSCVPSGTVAAQTRRQPKVVAPPARPAATVLTQNAPAERALKSGEEGEFQLDADGDRFLDVAIAQDGVDVAATLTGPDGETLADVDLTGPGEAESVKVITKVGGRHTLVVAAGEGSGRVVVKIQTLRAPTPEDRALVAEIVATNAKIEAATKIYGEAETLRKARKAESYRAAIPKYEESVRLWHELKVTNLEAGSLDGLGTCYSSLGDKRKAIELFTVALDIVRADQDRQFEATLLNSLAINYTDIGEAQKAFELFNEALRVSRAAGVRQIEGAALNSIGKLYIDLGAYQKALRYCSEALPIRRALKDNIGVARTLNNIGLAYLRLGKARLALRYYSQALPLTRATKDLQGEARAFNNIGYTNAVLRAPRRALDAYTKALALWQKAGDRVGFATTLDNVGQIYGASGSFDRALEFYNRALPIRRELYDRRGEAATLYGIARVLRDRGDLANARTQVEQAVAITESLRGKIADQDLRSSYFATVQKYYQLYVDILMQLHKRAPTAGHDREALRVSERARARSLLDFLAEASADIRQGVDAALLDRERTLQRQLSESTNGVVRLLNGPHTVDEAGQARGALEALRTELDQVEDQIRATSPRYAALTQPRILGADEIQRLVLDDDTALLEYSLGEDRSYVWVVTRTDVRSFELPSRPAVEAKARAVRDILSVANRHVEGETLEELRVRVARANAVYPQVSGALSAMVLAPALEGLGAKRLLVVTDGVLQYIPFAALPQPRRAARESGTPTSEPLIARFEIACAPSASTVAVLREETNGRAPAPNSIAVFADPVFDANDPRVGKHDTSPVVPPTDEASTPLTIRDISLDDEPPAESSTASPAGLFGRLPATRIEADRITALDPSGEVMKAVDFGASLSAVKSPEVGRYRVVHFATHAIVEQSHPELSGILLSLVDEHGEPQDGFLAAADVYNLDLPAELVVLSACRSGLGTEVRGEGLVGLTRGFMYAGAPRVVVSLWSAVDESTKELMVRFYDAMLTKHLPPAAALREAQLSMAARSQWRAPQYWAAFTLQGEWR